MNHALIDGDVLRYEIGFASETGWRHVMQMEGEEEALPPWDYVEKILRDRMDYILQRSECDSYTLYLSEGRSFRDAVAVTRPYKGNRPDKKPWHHKNLTGFMSCVLDATIVTGIEADDQIAMDHEAGEGRTVVCSRDKDFRQLSGRIFSWELGNQPEYSATHSDPGHLDLRPGKLTGSGFAFFCSQCLTGDVVDNIPGLQGYGPKKAHIILSQSNTVEDLWQDVREHYEHTMGDDWKTYLREQATLLWLMRGKEPWWYESISGV